MEPPSGLSPDREQLLVLANSSTLITGTTPLAPATQHNSIAQLCVKPTSLSLQPLIEVQTSTQLLPSAQINNNLETLVTVTSGNDTASGSNHALVSIATSVSTQVATDISGSSVGYFHPPQHHPTHQQQQQQQRAGTTLAAPHHHQHHGSVTGSGLCSNSMLLYAGGVTQHTQQQTIEKLSRPMAFDKMEVLVREMQDQGHGVPVRQQKMFLTSIPYAFMGYDLIEWLMDRLQIEESEALNIANQLCLHGYFFPVNDSKMLTVKDDSSLYRFQTPYYWPWQHKAPDNVEYAIYLAKRSLRNKQRHALEEYEAEALSSLHKNLKGKWDFISMQAEEQVRLAKERKKGDKIVGDSQERAYWRVHRPPPGQFTPLEPCPVPSRDRQGLKPNKRKTADDLEREMDYLRKSLNRTRMKMSQACESLVGYSETFSEYDFFLHSALPSNPWVTEDIAFWQLNSSFVDIPTEKRVKRWAISIEELLSDPTGLQEFTIFLEKEYSHENIRFWIAVNHLRHSAHSQVVRKANEIFEEFLKPGAPCEINIDGKTMESVLRGLKNPSRFTFDSASEHIYMLLLKKDCYPRFVRSEHYRRLIDSGIQPSHKKRFFNFGGVSGAKKKVTAALANQTNLGDVSKCPSSGAGGSVSIMQTVTAGSLVRRRGSDRSLTGSAHELAVMGVNKEAGSKVPHSHSQHNLSENIYREIPNTQFAQLETTEENLSAAACAVCPWDELAEATPPVAARIKLSVCPWEQKSEKSNTPLSTSPLYTADTADTAAWPLSLMSATMNSSEKSLHLTSICPEICNVNDRMQRNFGIRHQNTVDSGESFMKRLMPNSTEHRRASVSFTPSAWEYQFGHTSCPSITTSPTVKTRLPPLEARSACIVNETKVTTKDVSPCHDAKVELENELIKKPPSQHNKGSSACDPPILEMSASKPISSSISHITSPPKECALAISGSLNICISSTSKSVLRLYNETPSSSLCLSTNAAMLKQETEVAKEVQIELIKPLDCERSYTLLATTPTNKMKNQTFPLNKPHAITKRESRTEAKIDKQIETEGDTSVKPQLMESGEAELSPTTDEYQEGMHFGDASKDAVYDYEIVDTDRHLDYIPPATTMAPLAVLDVDTVDDEPFFEQPVVGTPSPTISNDEVCRRQKKRNSETKKIRSLDEHEKGAEKAIGSQTTTDESKHNAVCPWEDEDVITSDGTFVKTYATLGYL